MLVGALVIAHPQVHIAEAVQGAGCAGPDAGGQVQLQSLLMVLTGLLIPALLRFDSGEVLQCPCLAGLIAGFTEQRIGLLQLAGGLMTVAVMKIDLAEGAERGRLGGAVTYGACCVYGAGVDDDGLREVAASCQVAGQRGGQRDDMTGPPAVSGVSRDCGEVGQFSVQPGPRLPASSRA